MVIPVDVPGLDRLLGGIPPGRILVLRGGVGHGKGVLAQRMASAAARAGRSVAFLATRPLPLLAGSAVHVEPVERWPDRDPPAGADLFVDSFSLLHVDAGPAEVARRLRTLSARAVRSGSAAVLVVDAGVMEPRSEAVLTAMADGLIEFHVREDAETAVDFLRVPRWVDGQTHGANLYYTLHEDGILIDMRRRVG